MTTIEEQEKEKLSLDSILGKWSKGEKREEGLRRFAKRLKEIDSTLDFKQSARGWCYTLENEGIIDKGEFDRAETAINTCRKLGYLDIDFCAEDVSRRWDNVEEPTEDSIEDLFKQFLRAAANVSEYYTPYWWEGERYYIQMLVEKVDLKSLFEPVCKRYHIPIANAAGWSDINERAEMADRFLAADEKEQECVLLYCGDHDPWGLKIESTLRDNLEQLMDATGYDPFDLIINRFGLKYDFIENNNLTWIDNLTTGSGKDMTKSFYCYSCKVQHKEGTLLCRKCGKRLYAQPQFVRDYIDKYGERKCEANALVVAPIQGRQLAENAITRYLGVDAISRFNAKRDKVRKQFQTFKQLHPILFSEIDSQLRRRE
jgi:hypothetical protein